VGGLCEAVAGLKFNPGDHVYLENIDIQVRQGCVSGAAWITAVKNYCGGSSLYISIYLS
jgi:hypothetical protein